MPQSGIFPHQWDPWDAARSRWIVTSSAVGATTVVTLTGSLDGGLLEMHREVLYTLAEQPGGILCDLSRASGELDDHAVAVIVSMTDQTRMCAGSPLALVGTAAHVARLGQLPPTSATLTDRSAALSWLSQTLPQGRIARTRLAADRQSARAARQFLEATWQGWGLVDRLDDGKLVVNELVTNAVLHARTDIDVTLSACDGRRRVGVRDRSHTLDRPLRRIGTFPESPSGRGLLLVERLCTTWGVLPTRDGGKTVWASVDEPLRLD